MVQHNAAKFITNSYPKKGDYENFSVSKILKELNFVSLEKRREQARLTMAYKIINGHVILESQMLPKSTHQRPLRECNAPKVGFEHNLFEPEPSLQTVDSTFFYSTPKIWNSNVESCQAKAPSIEAFKQHFKKT